MYRLLIADDEQLEREAIKFIIVESFPGSFTICEAANGLEVVEIALAFKPDLLFLDIKMPGINGLQAAAQINRVLPECRIIIVTAFHYFNYAKEALSLGVVDYITKPAPPEAVVETVKRLIVELESASFKERLAAEREQQLQQITRYFEDDLLVLIAYGEIEAKEIEDYFAILNLQAQTFFAAVATILYPNTPGASILEIEKRVLNKNVVGWVKEYMQKVGRQAYIRSIGAEVFILLLAQENLDEYQARLTGMRLFTELKEALWKEQQIALNIGIGGLCNETGQIGQAFSQAKYALRYEAAPDSIISYGDIERDQQQVFYPYHREKRLYQSILQGDIHASQQLLEDLLTWLREHTSCLEAFQQKVYELLLILMREMAIHTQEFCFNGEDLRQNIYAGANPEEISSFATGFLSQKITEINTLKTSRINALLMLAIDYIERNYQKDLSLEDVSSFIQISPFYLSKIFKKEVGVNFIDYLTKIRLQKAKEFLADPRLNIKDICYQVGYKDPNYFTRVFKKNTGLTPTEYQAKTLK
ncbi:MAG TPA: hypothetical protein DD734_06290 [Firmicutes bacterium]|nr:hypothetical protein [Bacillota bacterium]